MNPENITEQCRDCPNLQPYIFDVNLIRAKMVELITLQVSYDDPSFFTRLNSLENDLRESQEALGDAHVITTGCSGVIKSNGGVECDSFLNPSEIHDDIF